MSISQATGRSEGNSSESEPIYQAVATVRSAGGPDKHVRFEADGVEAVMGMSGGLAQFYGAEPGTYDPRASTLDYVVGATAACLTGTLRRALAVRGVVVAADGLSARAVGDVVVEDGVPQLKRILVSYRLSAPAGADRAVIDRAHALHHRACAVSRSLEAAIEIRTELKLEDAG
jgi:organic hydroperoxide reductase OsmC/OhrA